MHLAVLQTVEVDGEEEIGVGVAGDFDPAVKPDLVVAIAGHHHPIAAGCFKLRPQAHGQNTNARAPFPAGHWLAIAPGSRPPWPASIAIR